MQSQEIKEVESHKHLSLCFSNDGVSHTHINFIRKKSMAQNKNNDKIKVSARLKIVRNYLYLFQRDYFRVWDNKTSFT